MPRPYTVVLEYNLTAGGLTGTRFFQTYLNKDNFNRTYDDKNGHITIIHQGVSYDEANNLISLTPEVCRLSAAVEHLCCNPDESISSLQTANFEVTQAIIRIFEDRIQRRANGLNPIIPFSFVTPNDDFSHKSQLFRFIKLTFDSPDGAVGNSIPLAHSYMMTKIEELYALSNHSPAPTKNQSSKPKKSHRRKNA